MFSNGSLWLPEWHPELPSSILALSRLNRARPTVQLSGLSPTYVRHLREASVPGALGTEGLARDLNEIGLQVSTGAER